MPSRKRAIATHGAQVNQLLLAIQNQLDFGYRQIPDRIGCYLDPIGFGSSSPRIEHLRWKIQRRSKNTPVKQKHSIGIQLSVDDFSLNSTEFALNWGGEQICRSYAFFISKFFLPKSSSIPAWRPSLWKCVEIGSICLQG